MHLLYTIHKYMTSIHTLYLTISIYYIYIYIYIYIISYSLSPFIIELCIVLFNIVFLWMRYIQIYLVLQKLYKYKIHLF